MSPAKGWKMAPSLEYKSSISAIARLVLSLFLFSKFRRDAEGGDRPTFPPPSSLVSIVRPWSAPLPNTTARWPYYFGAQGLAALFAAGAQGVETFVVFGAQGFMAFPALGAHGFDACAEAASGATATRPPIATIEPRVCRDFLSADILASPLGGGTSTGLHNRVVTVTSQSGMARVREASTNLSRPVRTKAPMPMKAAPISGLPRRDIRANQLRRAKIACLDP